MPPTAKSAAGAEAGKPCLPCQKPPQKPQPPPPQPCDIQKIQIKCKHCGKYDKREDFQEGVIEADVANAKIKWSYPIPKNTKRRPWKRDVFEVTASQGDAFQDTVTLTITRAPCYHPGVHPTVSVTPPPEIGGAVVVHRGVSELPLQVSYPNDWFKKNLASARNTPGLAALSAFFYPPPVTYSLLIQACGVRAPGQPRWGSFKHSIAVYPNDVFKLGLSIPPHRKADRAWGGGKEGSRSYSTQSNSSQVGGNANSMATTTTTGGGKPTAIQQTEQVRDRKGGVQQTDVLSEKAGGGTDHQIYMADLSPTDRPVAEALKSISFTHNGQNIANQFKFVVFVEKILAAKKVIEEFVEFLATIARNLPQIGWKIGWSFEIFSGAFELEWGWKEWKEDNTVFPYWKISASLTIFNGRFEISFGASVLGAKAEIFGAITLEAKLTAAGESEPDRKCVPSFAANIVPMGEIGARGALGDFVEIEGKMVAGFEGELKLELMPWKLEAKIDIAEAKGIFTIGVCWKLWTRNKEWKMWDKRKWKEWKFIP